MAAVILKEVNRLPGLVPETTIIAGQPCKIGSASNKVTLWSWNNAGTAPEVLGLAMETTSTWSSLSSIPTFKLNDSRGLVDPNARPSSDQPSGDVTIAGTFYSDVSRGGLVSVLLNGAEVDLYDDGRGTPFEVAPSTSYALNALVYADAEASVITADSTSASGYANKAIGVCLKTPTDNILRIKLTI